LVQSFNLRVEDMEINSMGEVKVVVKIEDNAMIMDEDKIEIEIEFKSEIKNEYRNNLFVHK